MSGTLSLGSAIGIFAGAAFALVLIAVAGLPETKGKEKLIRASAHVSIG
jgi:hypothetical protein